MENGSRELASFRFKTERGKTFFFDIKENDGGRFIKVTESRPRAGESDSYIRNFMTIPELSVDEFIMNLKSAYEYLKENYNDEKQ